MSISDDPVIAHLEALREDVQEVKQDVKDTKAEVKRTNGRVSALEIWKAEMLARFSMVRSGGKWGAALVGSVTTGVVTAVVVGLLTH